MAHGNSQMKRVMQNLSFFRARPYRVATVVCLVGPPFVVLVRSYFLPEPTSGNVPHGASVAKHLSARERANLRSHENLRKFQLFAEGNGLHLAPGIVEHYD